jgi:PRTRC genetic system ThiF family protein
MIETGKSLAIEPHYRVILPETAATQIVQVGVGGTGSWLAYSLARLVYHARQKGQDVSLMLVDPDVIETANVGRQAFGVASVGSYKAEDMAWRLNLALGLDITAVAAPFQASLVQSWLYQPAYCHQTRLLLVGCVDNHQARRALAEVVAEANGQVHSTSSVQVWAVDCGNGRSNGQVLVGNRTDLSRLAVDELGVCNGLPSPYVQEPGLLEPDPVDETSLSCADLTLREEQSLLINAQVAAVAAQYVYDLVIRRTLWQYATYLNLEPPAMNSRLLTPTNLALWGNGRLPAVKEKNEQDNQTTTEMVVWHNGVVE